MSEKKEFVKGIFCKKKHPKSPDFVLGGGSMKRVDLIEFLNSKTDEWINFQILNSKAGKPYIVVDDWKPKQQQETKPVQEADNNNEIDSLPF